MNGIKNGHHWDRYVVRRVLLAVGSLVSFVLAAGAGGHWG
jgi:hypothetical protein